MSSTGKTASKKKKLKACVLWGGVGEERAVSIESGKAVTKALEEAGLDVVSSDITPENMSALDDKTVDVFFLALHGAFGEDGKLQRIMENRDLVYTGSGSNASEMAFNKMATKRIFQSAGIECAKAVDFGPEVHVSLIGHRLAGMGEKFVVKPIKQGSSVGIEIVEAAENAIAAGARISEQYGECMIEEFIAGKELTVGVLCGETLPIIEIRPKGSFYDYHAKYVADDTEFLFDTIEDEKLKKKIEKLAMKCFKVLHCRHFARVDFILSEGGEIYPLEINSIPGFTNHSLLPMAAKKAGLSMPELCEKIVMTAWKDSRKKV